MLPIRCELILAVILVAPAVSAQATIVPGTAASSNQLPPPPPPTAPKPATPQRIVVGSGVQSNYLGPEGRWLPSNGRRLSEADITAGEQFLTVNPDDFCTRARLIAFAYYAPTRNRIDHLLWMIQHHPEWEG